MRFLAIDYGTKRVGLAICDETEFGAFPLATIARSRSLPHDLEEIARRAAKEEAQAIVFGLPLNADGTTGKSAQAAEEFARALSRRTPLAIYLWDEFLTTTAAEEELIAQDVSRKRRRAVIDQMAAVQLLESFLQARRAGQTTQLLPIPKKRNHINNGSSNDTKSTWRTETAPAADPETPNSSFRDSRHSSEQRHNSNAVVAAAFRPAPPRMSDTLEAAEAVREGRDAEETAE